MPKYNRKKSVAARRAARDRASKRRTSNFEKRVKAIAKKTISKAAETKRIISSMPSAYTICGNPTTGRVLKENILSASLIPHGDDFDQREGNQIFVKGFNLWVDILSPKFANEYVKLILQIVRVKHDEEVDISNQSAVNCIVPDDLWTTQKQLDAVYNSQKFNTVWKKEIIFSQNNSYEYDDDFSLTKYHVKQKNLQKKYYVKINKKSNFTDTSNTVDADYVMFAYAYSRDQQATGSYPNKLWTGAHPGQSLGDMYFHPLVRFKSEILFTDI